MSTSSTPHSSSGGHAFAGVGWLDARYESSRVAYEAQVREVGFRPGWHVLDAGCGSGAFLPLLAELVGPTGQLTAVDVASENVATVNDRVTGWDFGGQVKTEVGSVVALPFADGTFDAVWCANTSQYLTDIELRAALAELIRVVRPGGLVAIKESDATLFRVIPAPVGIMLRAYVAGSQSGGIVERGMIRAAELPTWFRRAGMAHIRRSSTLLEHSTPLPEFSRQQWASLFDLLSERTAGADVPAEDRAFWSSLRQTQGLDEFLNNPDFYCCEGNTLVVGQVTGTKARTR